MDYAQRLTQKSGSGLSLAIALLALSTSALADNTTPNKHTGFYVGAGLGAIVTTDIVYDEPGFGLGANLGYMINPYIGLEVLYYLNPYYVNNSLTLFNITDEFSVLNQIYGGDVKLNLPLGNNFAIFAKGGYGGVTVSVNTPSTATDIETTSSSSKSGVLVGGGLSYSFGSHSELSLESDGIVLTSSNANSYYGFVGLVYNYHFA